MKTRTYSRTYAASLPVSSVVYPDRFVDKLKYYAFKAYNPAHPFFRDFLLTLRLIRHEGRQNYLFGIIKEDKSVDDFLTHLVKNGFGNHFVAWRDDGEIASLRLMENFVFQYHIRVFEDGEVRGHCEYTPEYHPAWHLNEKDMTAGLEKFSEILDGWVE